MEEEFSRLLLALEDRPSTATPALVDHFENAVADRLGASAEVRAVAEALAAPGASFDERSAKLAAIQERINLSHKMFRQELAAFERIRALLRLGRERGGEWQSWARAVKMAIESCAPPFDAAQSALLACWRELAARGGFVFVGKPVFLPEATVTFAKEPTRKEQ